MDFSPEELTLMQTLGISVPKLLIPKPVVYKTIKAITTCKLCKTVTVQYFLMAKHAGVWLKESELDPEKDELPKPIGISNTTISVCYACTDVLTKKSKLDLVNMLLDFCSFKSVTTSRNELQRRNFTQRRKVKI